MCGNYIYIYIEIKAKISMEETVKLKKAKKTRVIPGFKLTMGITVTMLSLIVLIPLASVMVYSLKLPPSEFIKLITKQNVVYAFTTSIVCSFKCNIWSNSCMDTCKI